LPYPCREIDQHAGRKPLHRSVFRGAAYAVIGGDANDVDPVDMALSEPVTQRGPAMVESAEPAVAGVVGAFTEDRVEPDEIKIGVEFRAGGIGATVRRPRRDVIRMFGEMVAGIDVEILRGHHVAILGAAREVSVDGTRDGCPTGDGQCATFAKVILNVDDDQRTHETTLSPTARVPESSRSFG